MDTLQISGKQYISSGRAAKDNGYTSDYIGQLIRGGKLKGQKVGRAWYVLEDSLNEFLSKEGGGQTAPVKEEMEEAPAAAVQEPEAVEEEKEEPEPAALPQSESIEDKPEEATEEKIEVQEEVEEPVEKKEIEEIKTEVAEPEPVAVPMQEQEKEPEAPPAPKVAPAAFSRSETAAGKPARSVREHVLMTYLRDDTPPAPVKKKEPEEVAIPIHTAPSPATVLQGKIGAGEPKPQTPAVRPLSVHQAPAARPRRKKRVWRAALFILLLGIVIGGGAAAASVFIPAILIYP